MKSLGICIPTYRRPEMLRECVESAFASAQGKPIQVFIADDSMTDVNVAVLERLVRDHPGVTVQRNRQNLGIDRNIQAVLDMSSCDYHWLIGEDDRFVGDGVRRMHEAIQHCDESFLFSNYQYVSEDHRRVIGVALPQVRDGTVEAAEFIEKNLWSIGFIGGCVVERGEWLKTSAAPYDGTYFTHVGRIVDMLARRSRVRICATPAVANRAQGDDTFTWKKDSFGVFLGFERMCRTAAQRNEALRPFIQAASVNYRRKFAYFSYKTGFRLRSEGAFDFRQFKTYVYGSDIDIKRKGWFLLMSALPSAALKPLARLYVAWAMRQSSQRPLQ
jgi:glycosyltransferase involved in cell wall biosynthesis